MIWRSEHGLLDREALRCVTKRTQSLISIHCTPTACDVPTRVLLYPLADVELLNRIPRRTRRIRNLTTPVLMNTM